MESPAIAELADALWHAAKEGLVHDCTRLLDCGADINAVTDGMRQTALRIATWKGHCSVVALLASRGADLDLAPEDGRTALSGAVGFGRLDIVEVLHRHGASPHLPDRHGRTPLSYAAHSGHHSCAAFLISVGVAVDEPDEMLRSPLAFAIQNSHTETAALLLRHGADVHKENRVGRSPFFYAAMKSRGKGGKAAAAAIEASDAHAAAIAANGGEPAAPSTPPGGAPGPAAIAAAAVAAGKGGEALLRLLVANHSVAPLARAAQIGNVMRANALVMAGADLELRAANGRTPLQVAASCGYSECVRLLLAAGADVTAVDREGRTARSLAPPGPAAELLARAEQAAAEGRPFVEFSAESDVVALQLSTPPVRQPSPRAALAAARIVNAQLRDAVKARAAAGPGRDAGCCSGDVSTADVGGGEEAAAALAAVRYANARLVARLVAPRPSE